jgi:hypothetical protein
VADNIGVYTTQDYANIVEHLVRKCAVFQWHTVAGKRPVWHHKLLS